MNPFDQMFGGKSSEPIHESTAERIADAVELLAAITAHQFFTANNQDAGAHRFAVLVKAMASRFAKRHGA